MHSNPLRAYESVKKATATGRDVEADVLTKAALKLKDCQINWHAPDFPQRLDAALKFNQRIWTTFQSELAQKDHPLGVLQDGRHIGGQEGLSVTQAHHHATGVPDSRRHDRARLAPAHDDHGVSALDAQQRLAGGFFQTAPLIQVVFDQVGNGLGVSV